MQNTKQASVINTMLILATHVALGVTVFQWNTLYKEKTLNSQSFLKIIMSRLDKDSLGLMSIL